MPPKGSSTALQPMRLPPLPKLRVRRPNQADANPCLAIMSSVLSTQLLYTTWTGSIRRENEADGLCTACWASSGHTVAGCQAIETQLRACMDTPVGSTSLTTLLEPCFGIRGRWGAEGRRRDNCSWRIMDALRPVSCCAFVHQWFT